MPTFTVATTATKIADSSVEERTVRIHNRSAVIIYIDSDSSTISTTTSYQIPAGADEDITIQAGEQLFAVVASGTAVGVDVI